MLSWKVVPCDWSPLTEVMDGPNISVLVSKSLLNAGPFIDVGRWGRYKY